MPGELLLRRDGEPTEIALSGRPRRVVAVNCRGNAFAREQSQRDIGDLHWRAPASPQPTSTALPMTLRSIRACIASVAASSGKRRQMRGLSLPCPASSTSVSILAGGGLGGGSLRPPPGPPPPPRPS